MMLLLKRKLIIVTDAEEVARIKLLLKSENIPFSVQTKTSVGAFGRGMASSTNMQYNRAYDLSMTYVYTVSVRPWDYDKAKALIS